MSGNPAYLDGLEKNQANYATLTPLTFLERAAYVYPQKPSVVHGAQRFTWKQTYERCRRLASALARRGIGKNDTVAVIAPNTPPMYEAHFGVPMCGAVLNTLNTRLDPESVAFMLQHGGARVLITDREFSATVEKALALLPDPPLVVEGAGGLMVPLDEKSFMIDLARDLELPLILVVRSTLGTINHTLLSVEAIRRRGLPLAGVVINGPETPHNRAAIERYGKVEVIAEIPWLDQLTPATLAAIEPELDLGKLARAAA